MTRARGHSRRARGGLDENTRELGAVIDRAAILGNGRTLEIATSLGLSQPLPQAPSGNEPTYYEVVPETTPPLNPPRATASAIATLDTAMGEHIVHYAPECENFTLTRESFATECFWIGATRDHIGNPFACKKLTALDRDDSPLHTATELRDKMKLKAVWDFIFGLRYLDIR